jgi:hypothetical protein
VVLDCWTTGHAKRLVLDPFCLRLARYQHVPTHEAIAGDHVPVVPWHGRGPRFPNDYDSREVATPPWQLSDPFLLFVDQFRLDLVESGCFPSLEREQTQTVPVVEHRKLVPHVDQILAG